MTQPLVSICVPTYRGAAYIGATIDSVLHQTLTDWQMVVVDDNSPDDTEAVVKRYADNDPRISYHRNAANLGPEGNWNRGLDLLNGLGGTYYKLLPHDDLLAPDGLARQVQVLAQDTKREISLVFGEREVIGPDGQVLMRRGPGERAARRFPAAELVRRCARAGTNLIGEPGNGLCRMADAQRIGRYDARFPYVVDMDYWFRLLALGDAYYTGRVDSSFRISGGQWSVAIGASQHRDFMGLVDRVAAQGGFGLTATDRGIAALRSRANNWARMVFYKLLFLRQRRGAVAPVSA